MGGLDNAGAAVAAIGSPLTDGRTTKAPTLVDE